MSETVFAPDETVGAAELARAGLLLLGEQADIDATTVFVLVDAEGAIRRILIGSGAPVGAYTVIYRGACIGENAQVEEHTIVGKPERGYAVGHVYPVPGRIPRLASALSCGPGGHLRRVQAKTDTVIGHHTLLQSFVTVGKDTQLGPRGGIQAQQHEHALFPVMRPACPASGGQAQGELVLQHVPPAPAGQPGPRRSPGNDGVTTPSPGQHVRNQAKPVADPCMATVTSSTRPDSQAVLTVSLADPLLSGRLQPPG